ncbi:hypothetical protein ACSQ67_023917 [Phaseolus vulgaris]
MKHEAVWASFGHKLFGREETAEPRKCHRTGEAESSTRRCQACNKRFKASEPSISEPSNSWMPRLRRPPSKRLARRSKAIVCPTCNKSLFEGQVLC